MKQAFLILFLALLFSGVFYLNTNTNLIGDGGDSYEYFGFMYLTKRNLASFKHPFAETDILRYPGGFDYSFGFDGVFAIVTGAILSFIFNPILAYNLTVLIILFANILVSYYSFVKLGQIEEVRSNVKLKALISALIFGASPYVFARIYGHLNLAFVAGFPVVLVSMLNLNKKIIQKDSDISFSEIITMYIGALLILFGSLQYFILLTFILPIFFAYFISKNSFELYKDFVRKNIKKILISTAIFLAIFFYFYFGYFRGLITGQLVFSESKDKFFRPGFYDVFFPNKFLGEWWGWINTSSPSIEKVITIGSIELLMVIYLVERTKRLQTKFFGVLIFIIYLLCSYGVVNLPFYPEGGRITVLFSLFAAIVFMLEADAFNRSFILPLIFTLLVTERLFFNLSETYPLSSRALSFSIRETPGEAVLNVPLSKYDAYRSALPVFYEKKVLDGYFHYTAANTRSQKLLQDELFSRFICELEREDQPSYTYKDTDRIRLWDSLRMMDIKNIVLFKNDNLGRFYWDDCANVRDWWFWLNPETIILSQDTSGVIKNTFEIDSLNPHTIVQIYFERAGRFVLDGVFVSPKELFAQGEWSVILPDGTRIKPQWQEVEEGFEAPLDPSIEVDAKPGDFVRIESDAQVDFSRYISTFYFFDENEVSLERKKVPMEAVYEDENVEIFQLNF